MHARAYVPRNPNTARACVRVRASACPRPAAGGGRYLSGDLSYFGVGSKNAAFFMGMSVKLATRQASSGAVHELLIAGAELERRSASGAGSGALGRQHGLAWWRPG